MLRFKSENFFTLLNNTQTEKAAVYLILESEGAFDGMSKKEAKDYLDSEMERRWRCGMRDLEAIDKDGHAAIIGYGLRTLIDEPWNKKLWSGDWDSLVRAVEFIASAGGEVIVYSDLENLYATITHTQPDREEHDVIHMIFRELKPCGEREKEHITSMLSRYRYPEGKDFGFQTLDDNTLSLYPRLKKHYKFSPSDERTLKREANEMERRLGCKCKAVEGRVHVLHSHSHVGITVKDNGPNYHGVFEDRASLYLENNFCPQCGAPVIKIPHKTEKEALK